MKNLASAIAGVALYSLTFPNNSAVAQGTAFTYQGQLSASASEANGTYDFTFGLYNNSSTNSGQVGAALTNLGVGVTNGLFTVTLDFGANFPGASRWLAIGVRTNGAASFTALNPLQPLTPAPYAIYTPNAGTAGSVLAANISGVVPISNLPGFQSVSNYNTVGGGQGNTDDGSHGTIGGGLDNYINGNGLYATVGGGNTNLATAYAATVAGGQQNNAAGQNSTVGGGVLNQTLANGATIAGGGFNGANIGNIASGLASSIGGGVGNTNGAPYGVIGGGYYNTNTGNYATVPGGYQNQASGLNSFAAGSGARATNNGAFVWSDNSSSAPFSSTNNNSFNVRAEGGVVMATAGGGMTLDGQPVFAGNNGSALTALNASQLTSGVVPQGALPGFQASSNYSVVGGGQGNVIALNADHAGIGSGLNNTIGSNDYEGTIAGGFFNTLSPSSGYSTVGGGEFNTNASYVGTIAGGQLNLVTGQYQSTIGGGYSNLVSGSYATVPGGFENVAGGVASFAAGSYAHATNQGSFVWSDNSSSTPFDSTSNNQFNVRALGGVQIATGGASIGVDGPITMSNLIGSLINYGPGTPLFYADQTGNFFSGPNSGNVTTSANGGSWNAGTGSQALMNNISGSYNAAAGPSAMRLNSSGSYNVAVGYAALYSNTTAFYNTAVGNGALSGNTSGAQNVAVGSSALYYNAGASYNVAVGVGALENNNSGTYNTGLGNDALFYNTSGGYNVGTGDGALNQLTTGNGNTSSGALSLLADQTDSLNSAFGYKALTALTSGGNNIAVGAYVGSQLQTGSNNVYIANQGVSSETGVIRIGTQGFHTAAYIGGISGATVASGVAVYVDSNGMLGTLTSSERFKRDIRSMDDASDVLLSLRPVTFKYKTDIDPKGTPQFGLIAEEVDKVDPDLVARDGQGRINTVRYEAVNAMLLNEFLKQHQKLDEQTRKVEEQAGEIKVLKEKAAKLDSLERRLGELESLIQPLTAKR